MNSCLLDKKWSGNKKICFYLGKKIQPEFSVNNERENLVFKKSADPGFVHSNTQGLKIVLLWQESERRSKLFLKLKVTKLYFHNMYTQEPGRVFIYLRVPN